MCTGIGLPEVSRKLGPSQPGVSFLDERLKPLLTIDLPDADLGSVHCVRPVSRIALREALLQGLDETVQFSTKFVAFDDTPDGRTRNVTLLGDALHNMTPFRGMGANVALRDAAALRCALVRVVRGESLLLESLAAYEREMIEYGFRAVRASLANMRMVHSEGIGRELTELGFRLMSDLMRFFARLGPFVG
jgi:2-polyprenyl-6-methoxyphenol hydroxylase-like FAD-dependent oxidoreductase